LRVEGWEFRVEGLELRVESGYSFFTSSQMMG
jgi:hypothetical protein